MGAKTRIFIGLQVSADQLQNCVDSIDVVLKEFNQPTFYKTPKFHTSLLWCLPVQDNLSEAPQDVNNSPIMRLQEELHSVIEEINKEIHTAIENEVLDISGFWATNITAKIGNKILQFNFIP